MASVAMTALTDIATTAGVGVETNTWTYDVTAPTLTITTVPTSPSKTNAGLVYTFEFSEDVTGFAVGDITLNFNGTGLAAVDGSTFDTTDANTYTLTLANQDLTDLVALADAETLVASVAMTALTDIATTAGVGATANTWTYDVTAPTFTMQYYTDSELTSAIADNAKLKAGTYYIKITSNEALSAAPTISLAAEGTANDVTNQDTTLVSGNDYTYTRVIASDGAAVGAVIEAVTITGTDVATNTATDANPTNEGTKAIYTDTTAPTVSFDPNSATWTSTAIDVTITGADGGSGIANIYHQNVVKDVSCPAVGDGYTDVAGSDPVDISISTDGEWEICAYAQDVAGNTAGTATKSGVYQYDTDEPTIQSGTYVHSTKVLTLTFDDTLTEVTKTQITLANTAEGGDGFTLGDDDSCTQDGSTDATCTLSDANRNTISSWDGQGNTTLYISVGVGAVKDKASQDNTAGTTSITGGAWTEDTVVPTYSSNIYDTGTGVLTITFSENLIAGTSNVDLSKIYIVGSDETSNDLNGSTVDSVSTATVTITLSSAIKPWLDNLNFTSSYLKFDAGAVQDLGANSIVANTGDNAITADSTAPALSSVTSYDYATKQLTLVFNDTIKYSLVNVSKITLGTTATVTGKNSIPLTGATVTTSSNNETIVITLITDQRNIIQDTFGTPSVLYVRLDAGAVTDKGDNTNDALTTGIEITTISHKDQIALISGWNLISVPYQMNSSNDNFTELLEGYDPTIYIYTGSAWDQRSDIKPLYGYLVNVNHSGVVDLSPYKSQVGTYPMDDADRYLNANKWYTIGASTRTSETASSVFNSTSYRNLAFMEEDGSYSNDGVTNLIFGKGYWVHTGTSPIGINENLART